MGRQPSEEKRERDEQMWHRDTEIDRETARVKRRGRQTNRWGTGTQKQWWENTQSEEETARQTDEGQGLRNGDRKTARMRKRGRDRHTCLCLLLEDPVSDRPVYICLSVSLSSRNCLYYYYYEQKWMVVFFTTTWTSCFSLQGEQRQRSSFSGMLKPGPVHSKTSSSYLQELEKRFPKVIYFVMMNTFLWPGNISCI